MLGLENAYNAGFSRSQIMSNRVRNGTPRTIKNEEERPGRQSLKVDHPKLKRYYGHEHVYYKDYEKDIKPHLADNHIVFSFVRNPYHRWASVFFRENAHMGVAWDKAGKPIQEFRNFVLYACKDINPAPQQPNRHGFPNWIVNSGWGTQTDFLINNNGEIDLDFIGKLENMKEDWSKLEKQFGFPSYDEKYRHTSPLSIRPVCYEDLYDKTAQDLIYERFEQDFINFNYSYELT